MGNDDLFIEMLDESLERGLPVFAIFSPDGTLEILSVELLQRKYSNQFEIISASRIPTLDELNGSISSAALETGTLERSCQGLLRFLGLKSWPRILIISNSESLSADQALALRGCLNESEWDEPSQWPLSIIFVLKQGEFLQHDLIKFVRLVLEDPVSGD